MSFFFKQRFKGYRCEGVNLDGVLEKSTKKTEKYLEIKFFMIKK